MTLAKKHNTLVYVNVSSDRSLWLYMAKFQV